MAQHQLPGLGTREGITPVSLRLTITDIGTPHDPLIIAHRIQVRHRHGQYLTVDEREFRGKMLDVVPSGWSDLASAFLWGQGLDVTRAYRDLSRAARRHAR